MDDIRRQRRPVLGVRGCALDYPVLPVRGCDKREDGAAWGAASARAGSTTSRSMNLTEER
jgi:hypothetical protein